MKKVIQLSLFFFLITISIIFYNTYLKKNEIKKVQVDSTEKIINPSTQTENNLIQNLKYEVNFGEKSKYKISSKYSELYYENNVEIVKMQNVTALFEAEDGSLITLVADKAIYNNSNYNTKFKNNVRVEYLDNLIFSDKIDLEFNSNTITIYENVRYIGSHGTLETDNLKINLITKKVDIYMEDNKDDVELAINN
tara:strand:- start:2844 stop:3428 length:585 start_codon:yes stop_codon:yes gene_type:complete